jgi:hypothetical protein
MFKKSLLIVAMLAGCSAVLAQTAAPAAANSPAKKEIIGKILKIQQSGIEQLARTLAEEPAASMISRAGPVLAQRVPQDKQEAVAKEIQADAKKYVDEAVPIVRDRAIKLAPTTVGALLEDKFTEDELKQVLAMMSSPVYTKFQSLGGDMQRVLTEKLVEDTRGIVEPKVRAMEESIARRLGVTNAAGGGNAPAQAPAAKAPAKK